MSGVIVLRCIVCGAEVQGDEQRCSKCIEGENEVQILTLEEKQEFSGITLVQGQEQQQQANGHYDSEKHTDDQRIYSKQFSIVNTGFLTKVILAIVILGVVFVALPVAILAISIVSLIMYFFRK